LPGRLTARTPKGFDGSAAKSGGEVTREEEVAMADAVRMVDYFYIMVGDKPGEGARVLSRLKAARVNLMALHAFPVGRRAQVDMVPANSRAFSSAAKKAGWKVVGPKRAFLIQGGDRVGALVGAFERLAAAKINVTATDAVTAGGRRFGSLLWVKQRDVARAKKALGAR
jgi:hypothetical protein